MTDATPEPEDQRTDVQPQPGGGDPSPGFWTPPWILVLAALIALLGLIWRCA